LIKNCKLVPSLDAVLKISKFILAASLFFTFSSHPTCLANTSTLKAEINPQTASVGERVEYTAHFESSESVSEVDFLPPDFEGFYVSGQSQSKSFAFVNGAQKVQMTWKYSLELANDQVEKIGAARCTFTKNGQKEVITSNEISFQSVGGIVKKQIKPFQEKKSKTTPKSQSKENKSKSHNQKIPSEEEKYFKDSKPSQPKSSAHGLKSEVETNQNFIFLIVALVFVVSLSLISFILLRIMSQKSHPMSEEVQSAEKSEVEKLSEKIKNLENSDLNLEEKFLKAEKCLREKLIKDGLIKNSTSQKQLKELSKAGKISSEVYEIMEIAELANYGPLKISEEVYEKTIKILGDL